MIQVHFFLQTKLWSGQSKFCVQFPAFSLEFEGSHLNQSSQFKNKAETFNSFIYPF